MLPADGLTPGSNYEFALYAQKSGKEAAVAAQTTGVAPAAQTTGETSVLSRLGLNPISVTDKVDCGEDVALTVAAAATAATVSGVAVPLTATGLTVGSLMARFGPRSYRAVRALQNIAPKARLIEKYKDLRTIVYTTYTSLKDVLTGRPSNAMVEATLIAVPYGSCVKILLYTLVQIYC